MEKNANDRRNLIDGLKATPPALDAELEKQFVFGGKATTPPPSAITVTPTLRRVPISTRMRSDFADALKRASLERQLSGSQPNTVQDILEQAIEPWLKANGYIAA